jgi:hypothetical protein
MLMDNMGCEKTYIRATFAIRDLTIIPHTKKAKDLAIEVQELS